MAKPTKIELHVGHFGDGTGAKGHIDEVAEARKVTKRIFEILQANKVPSTYFEDTTSKNQTKNLNTLVSHHNKDTNGLVVSVHFNAGGDGSKAIGTEVLYYDQKALAQRLVNAISNASGLKNRGAKSNKKLAVLKNTLEPAVLLEVCFVNSKIDVDAYQKNFEAICLNIAKVLATHIGWSVIDNVNTKAKGRFDIVEDKNAKTWRIQSGAYKTKEEAIQAYQKSGLPYATIRGTVE